LEQFLCILIWVTMMWLAVLSHALDFDLYTCNSGLMVHAQFISVAYVCATVFMLYWLQLLLIDGTKFYILLEHISIYYRNIF
jgi:hypothetical protein